MVRIDEDYGFQMFMGAIKKEFVRKYQLRFEALQKQLEELV